MNFSKITAQLAANLQRLRSDEHTHFRAFLTEQLQAAMKALVMAHELHTIHRLQGEVDTLRLLLEAIEAANELAAKLKR